MIDFRQCDAEPGDGPNDTHWALLSTLQRALRSLYNYLGSVAIAIEQNQMGCRDRFRDLCHRRDHRSFFWFCAQRDAFVNDQFETYTAQLEHAHVKLIQIAENAPGTLPQPTLLRRWSSALYGDFLSAYSRHVDWETAVLASYESSSGSGADPEFARQRGKEYFIHSWAHIPASRMRSHRLTRDHFGKDFGPFRSIRSAFFYLEMPLLFPLLYHECAHAHLDGESDKATAFFRARLVLTDHLWESAQHDTVLPQRRSTWLELTGEIWADAMSVALCGVGYVAALAMQLFAKNEGVFFERSSSEVGIDELGLPGRRIWEPLELIDERTFWEVRLRITLWLCRDLHGETLDLEMRDWLEGVEEAMEAQYQGGLAAFAECREHFEQWRYRRIVSDKVLEVAQEVIRPWIPRLSRHTAISDAYRISDPVAAAIKRAIGGLHKDIFGEEGVSSCDPGSMRIDQVALYAKWCFSKGALTKLNNHRLKAGGFE
ncbi:hypothetical protein [Thiorhodococcus drewsii]|uniref:hypothetical protein n=1 Tax=Thiorhodococcus drewsii TaxID=210408 RepID=UPI0003080E09|nr:hypothetical protein [Thiorhodococcus drewsii]